MTKTQHMIAKERAKIDKLNARITQLIIERTNIAAQIGALKANAKIAVVDENREATVIKQVRAIATEHGLDPKYIENIFRTIMKGARDVQNQK